MKFAIKNRWTGAVIFEADLSAEYERSSEGVRLGAAVKLAVKAGADLTDANLTGADLAGAYLAGAYLAGADLAGADLAGANLTRAYLADTKNIKPDQLESARQIDPADIPVIPKIDAAILAAIETGGTLDMSAWHGDGGTCGTTHCRAGWAVHLAGDKGRALEERIGSQMAGTLIYHASRPGQPAPHFFATNDDALGDLRKCAAEQLREERQPI